MFLHHLPSIQYEVQRTFATAPLKGRVMSERWRGDWRGEAEYLWDFGGSAIIVERRPTTKHFHLALIASADVTIGGQIVTPESVAVPVADAKHRAYTIFSVLVNSTNLQEAVEILHRLGEKINLLRDKGWCAVGRVYGYDFLNVHSGEVISFSQVTDDWDKEYGRGIKRTLGKLQGILDAMPQDAADAAASDPHLVQLKGIRESLQARNERALLDKAFADHPDLETNSMLSLLEQIDMHSTEESPFMQLTRLLRAQQDKEKTSASF